jgi:hypothetical protein
VNPQAELPDDGAGAALKHFDGTRATRYAEIFLIWVEPATQHLVGNVYNTYGLNDTEITGDSCPGQALAKINVDALKARYGVLGAFVNGPRLWTLDWIEVPSGVQRDFSGLQAAWVGKVDLSGMDLSKPGGTAYQPTTIERNTEFGFRAGKPVFVLDGPDGTSWVMKSAGLIVDPDQRFDRLAGLGNRLKPAPGWMFRAQELEEDLILRPEAGVAGIVQDELGNTYDLVGPGYSNYKP